MIDLMTSRRFAPVFWCQFLSAFNDNFIKNALVVLILYKVASEHGPALVTLAGSVLVIPGFFLSAIGGELADKYDKSLVAERLKRAEFPVAALAAAGFLMSASENTDVVAWSVPILFVALLLFGALAALFAPIKYGILPDHLKVEELPTGNALMEGATFFAILGGTLTGGLAIASSTHIPAPPAWTLALVMVVFAAFGWWSAALIAPTGAGQPGLKVDKNIFRSTFALIAHLFGTRHLWLGGLITSWFWLAGIVALSLFPTLVKKHIGGDPTVVVVGLVAFTIGIAIGSTLAAVLSKGRANLALVPIGAVLMGLFALDIAWVSSTLPRVDPGQAIDIVTFLATSHGQHLAISLAALAASGGLFIVPAFAAVQSWAAAGERARVVAAVNILNAAFMTFGTLSVTVLQIFGASVPLLFTVLGLANLVAAILIVHVWGLNGTRAEALAREPAAGGANG